MSLPSACIERCMTISTAHITGETANMLDAESDSPFFGYIVYPKAEFGWWIWLHNEEDGSACSDTNIPDDLLECMCLARNNRCDWLCLDRDADTVEEYLPVYQW